jgi:hypothetical protein
MADGVDAPADAVQPARRHGPRNGVLADPGRDELRQRHEAVLRRGQPRHRRPPGWVV